MNGAATVSVAYDKRATSLPSWLQTGWTATTDGFAVSDAPASPLRVYRKSVPAGSVTLGGNSGSSTGAHSHYAVVVKPSTATASASFAAAVPSDVWVHADDSDGDGLTDAFEAIHFLDSQKADTDGDGNPDETELDGLGRTLWEAEQGGAASAGGDGGGTGACGALGIEAALLMDLLRFRRRRARITGEDS